MPITFLAAESAQDDNGTARLLALIFSALAFWGFTVVHQRWKATRTPSSPAAQGSVTSGVKQQVTTGLDTSDTTAGTAVQKRPADNLDAFVAARVNRVSTSSIVAEGQARFRKSKSTILRAIKRAKAGSGADR